MGGKINCYIDCTSFYGFLALSHLLKNRDALAAHGVEVEFFPVFLGGINVGSGNKPPWSVAAKAKYGKFDSSRAMRYFGITNLETPPFFPILSILPQRAMCYVKATYPNDVFEKAVLSTFQASWLPPHVDISKPDGLREILAQNFSSQDVDRILAATSEPQWKKALTDITAMVVQEQGAFGSPWFWVTNDAGVSEPFFGSDRFHFMYEFLGIPWSDIEILPKSEGIAKL